MRILPKLPPDAARGRKSVLYAPPFPGGAFLLEESMTPFPHGLYVVSDSYFARFPSEHWMWNKGENRPPYFTLPDKRGLYWMIPLSSNASGYAAKIQREEQKRGAGNCLGGVSGRCGT